ncbi:MAG: hypothetical protein IJK23_09835 [Clostridia bacterium]|nr:hypothetical protein [Clostridia bacterium]
MKTNEELRNVPNLLILHATLDGGMGELFKLGKRFASVIWSTGGGWDHVSVCPYKHSYTPSWDDTMRYMTNSEMIPTITAQTGSLQISTKRSEALSILFLIWTVMWNEQTESKKSGEEKT